MLISESEDVKCEICKRGFTLEEKREYYSIQGKDYHKCCYEQQKMIDLILLSSKKYMPVPS